MANTLHGWKTVKREDGSPQIQLGPAPRHETIRTDAATVSRAQERRIARAIKRAENREHAVLCNYRRTK